MSELIFVLNNADWPVLLLDGRAFICHRNPAAVRVFGPPPAGGAVSLTEIWSPDNQFTPQRFVEDWQHTMHGTTPLKFRVNGGWELFQVNLCAFDHDQQEFFILQLLKLPAVPESVPIPSASPPPTTLTPGMSDIIVQRQKLECALQLARTVALDFNNALTSILGHTSLILGRMEPHHPWRGSLVEVEKSAARAAEIANDLASFSRQEKEVRSQAAGNLNQLLQRVMEMFQHTAVDRLAWNPRFTRKLHTAKFDEAKLQQVFIKIIENAIQSFGSQPGSITIQTRNLDLTTATQDRNAQLAPGIYVCVEISDNGSGIPAEVLPRIFEPFYTTRKPPHRGLGLAWVYGVVTNHGGGVAVSSQPGQGTSVRVYLPADPKFIQDGGFTSDELRGGQTILMVDDEDLLLTMGQAILSSFGYRVLIANSGQQALEILAKGGLKIDLLLTDLVMPGMSGRELVDQARQLCPHTRVLCTSGYLFPSQDDDRAAYLQKPFTSRELLLKVKAALMEEKEILKSD